MNAKTDLSIYTVGAYKYGGNKLKIISWFIINSLFINSDFPIPVAVKRWILRVFGAKIGKNVVIKPKVNIKYPWFLTIGDNTWVGEYVWIDNIVEVVIGKNACLSQGSMLLTGNHDYKKTTFDLITGKIILEDGAWIGAKSVVCPGITCESHSVLAVNSVATKNLNTYTIYQGNPAVEIRKRIIEK